MKNTLEDLNNHLFLQLERLNNDNLAEFNLDEEIQRARAISLVADKVINNAKLILETEKLISNEELKQEKISRVLKSYKWDTVKKW